MNDELPPMPEARTEDPELHPGGVDAIEDEADRGTMGRDLPPSENPAVDDALPEEIAEQDDKDQAPSGEADQEAGTDRTEDEDGPEAGQVDEEGSPEPPA
ncbi:hypothetical protein [Nocardioides gilvus]|uniref:hypothetical protein n=1 Tax=Nocardioides gilvus TaxID=1735589 RepID=UPI000D74FC38|nr:hypothetical protein [Nocardioides gilvus]